MLGRLFKPRDRGPALLSEREKEALSGERAEFAQAARQTFSDYQTSRAALLKAGGAELDHRPGYQDRWETAIRRLVQRGELREVVEYSSFPQARTYRYVLTPAGERVAEGLAGEAPTSSRE